MSSTPPRPAGEAPGVLLTDGQERSAPIACESLALAGYRVGAASCESPAPGRWSRFCDEGFDVPDPRADSAAFARSLAGICVERAFQTLMPGSDAAVVAISSHRDLFPAEMALGLPSTEVVDACVSKISLIESAATAGLPVPETVVCMDRGQVLATAARFGYPILLKPRQTTVSESSGSKIRQQASFRAEDEDALLGRLTVTGLPCLLQRLVSGPVYSIGGVAADGGLLGAAVSRYARTWPPDAGSVSCSETVAASADLLSRVERFVEVTRWQGIFELELIHADGEFSAIDFNPRLYGSLALAVEAGASLPSIWCDWLLRGRHAPVVVARPAVRYRWADADLRHVWSFLRRSRPLAAAAVLRPRFGTVRPFFRSRDPAPGIARILQMLGHRMPGRSSSSAGQPPEGG